jgi:hypothetical protein
MGNYTNEDLEYVIKNKDTIEFVGEDKSKTGSDKFQLI